MLILVPTLHETVRLFGANAERDLRHQKFSYQVVAGLRVEVSLCGFGMASSGSGAAFALTRYLQRNHQILPSRVILLGIAGSFDLKVAPIGAAVYGTEVHCHGIGIGEGDDFESASALGWRQGLPDDGLAQIGDRIDLSVPRSAYSMSKLSQSIRKGGIVSVCSASADSSRAKALQDRLGQVVLEDMESFSVGLACHLWKTPLTVIRGVSNAIGEHDKTKWKVAAALQSVRDLLPTAINQIQVENL